MKKILTVVGARPQFVKAAVLSRLIRSEEWSKNITEILLHTGQHYDSNMSEVFFDEMQIPEPDIRLKIGGTSHGGMTGHMLIEIEKVLVREKPDLVVVYGDTNSTIAGALAASKLLIPVVHIEAGLRSFNKNMPEEQNRILTDHLSSLLFCPSQVAVSNLEKEGLIGGVHMVGDIMYDATLYYKDKIRQDGSYIKSRFSNNLLHNLSNGFFLATIHRAENTDSKERLSDIVKAFELIDEQIVLPLHPRTKKRMEEMSLTFPRNVNIIDPIGYLEMVWLEMNSVAIITDSGGVQKEAYFLEKPCITLRDETEWIETVSSGWNRLVGADLDKILEACQCFEIPNTQKELYGDGNAGLRILNQIL